MRIKQLVYSKCFFIAPECFEELKNYFGHAFSVAGR